MPQPTMPQIPLDRPATYDDLVALPEHLVAEIVDGELWASPRPAPRHATADQRLGSILGQAFDTGGGGRGGWRILREPELHLGNDVVVPDLAGWRIDRMPRLPETAYFAQAPDWVCEILSPSTARLDREKKLRIYIEAGVMHAWLLDPAARTLEVLRSADRAWMPVVSHVGAQTVHAEPFEAADLRLGWLWDEE
jgi:Uma2 family endonuclease